MQSQTVLEPYYLQRLISCCEDDRCQYPPIVLSSKFGEPCPRIYSYEDDEDGEYPECQRYAPDAGSLAVIDIDHSVCHLCWWLSAKHNQDNTAFD